jgi:L-methionine (R)-S-oxide reductase
MIEQSRVVHGRWLRDMVSGVSYRRRLAGDRAAAARRLPARRRRYNAMTPNQQIHGQLASALEGKQGRQALQAAVEVLKRAAAHYTWVGIYLLEGQELVLGPYAGKPSPHVRIPIAQGICGAAAREAQTVVVPDVNADARYLACSLETRSEIVVPIFRDGKVIGEIDIDSDLPDAFTTGDRELLEQAAAMIAGKI